MGEKQEIRPACSRPSLSQAVRQWDGGALTERELSLLLGFLAQLAGGTLTRELATVAPRRLSVESATSGGQHGCLCTHGASLPPAAFGVLSYFFPWPPQVRVALGKTRLA